MNQWTQTRQREKLNDLEDHLESIYEACYKWLVNARSRNVPISATVLKTKALYIAKELGCNDFSASDGWLDRWKKRKNVSFTTISGLLDTECLFSNPKQKVQHPSSLGYSIMIGQKRLQPLPGLTPISLRSASTSQSEIG